MIVHNEPLFQIFFGDIRHKFIPDHYKNLPQQEKLLTLEPFAATTSLLSCKELVFLHQVHGASGLIIESQEQANGLQPFSHDGDFLVTDQVGIGLGIATADCMPVIIYDSLHQAISIVHAGWRGALNEIVPRAIEAMQKKYGTQSKHLKIFLGPCAKVCCYAVGNELLETLERFSFADQVLYENNGTTYFNAPLFMVKLLQQYGIKKTAINTRYNDCTICNELFCSYRRSKQSPYRQMTIAVLK